MKIRNVRYILGGALGYGMGLSLLLKDPYYFLTAAAPALLFFAALGAWERSTRHLRAVGLGWTGIALYCECPYCAFVNIRMQNEVRSDQAVKCDSCYKTFRVEYKEIRKRV